MGYICRDRQVGHLGTTRHKHSCEKSIMINLVGGNAFRACVHSVGMSVGEVVG